MTILLKLLYLVDRIRPYTKTDYERVGKKPKLMMNDSGLMSSLLQWNLDSIRFDGDRVGKLIETLILTKGSPKTTRNRVFEVFKWRALASNNHHFNRHAGGYFFITQFF